MSGTTTTAVGSIYLLFPDKPGYYAVSEIYDPDITAVAGSKLIVPQPLSLIGGDADDANVLYLVQSVDASTYKCTLIPIYTKYTNDGYGLSSIVSYGNTIVRAYQDTRTVPYQLSFDRLVFIGEASTYQVIRYPDDSSRATVISRYYDQTGTYTGPMVPMRQVDSEENQWYCPSCSCSVLLDTDEMLEVRVYNETGALIQSASVFAKPADIVNTALTYRPKIVDLQISASQMLSNNAGCYLYEKQSLSDLDITGVLVYSDGSTRPITIDGSQTFLLGAEDFVAGYAGQRQNLLLRYNLTYNETATGASTTTLSVTDGSISKYFPVTIISTTTAVPIKISVIPRWNAGTNLYTLRYFYYSTAHNRSIDVTDHVSIVTGSFDGSNYTQYQSFGISIDMNLVDPSTYPSSSIYVQSYAIRLQPAAALQRYLITDAQSSPYVYGADSSSSRRPILYFDSSRSQYFISTTLFQNLQALLESFYYAANPPVNNNVSSQIPVPTHFLVRDPYNGTMLMASPQALANYGAAFSLITTASSTYVGTNLVVEFLQQTADGTNLILYGVPVDVYAGTYVGS